VARDEGGGAGGEVLTRAGEVVTRLTSFVSSPAPLCISRAYVAGGEGGGRGEGGVVGEGGRRSGGGGGEMLTRAGEVLTRLTSFVSSPLPLFERAEDESHRAPRTAERVPLAPSPPPPRTASPSSAKSSLCELDAQETRVGKVEEERGWWSWWRGGGEGG